MPRGECVMEARQVLARYRTLYVTEARHDGQPGHTYRVPMPDAPFKPGHRFATLIKEGRERLGWTQEILVEESKVSRQTIIRYESGNATNPKADEIRRVCAAMKIDPREMVIALGYVTREEMDLPEPEPPLDPVLARGARLLADPKIPDRAKDALRKGINAAVELWFDAFGARRPPKELSAEERASKRAAAGK